MYPAAPQKFITRALKVIPIYVLLQKWKNWHLVFTAEQRKKFMCIDLSLFWNLWEKPQTTLISDPSSCLSFYSIFLLSLFAGSCSHPPSLSLPNFPMVQRQGTGSRHWLDFHTVPSTECHIKLIRVNNCGGALLSRAAIGLVWSVSGDTDGPVISVLEAGWVRMKVHHGCLGWCGCWTEHN